MNKIDLGEVIQTIQKRRKHVRHDFQDIALMLTEKLSDPEHKSLYFRIVKLKDRGLVMDALNYAVTSNIIGNKGKIFMWRLKQLEDQNADYTVYLQNNDDKKVIVGKISGLSRKNIKYVKKVVELAQKKLDEFKSIDSEYFNNTNLPALSKLIYGFFKRNNLKVKLQFSGKSASIKELGNVYKLTYKENPLTNPISRYKIH